MRKLRENLPNRVYHRISRVAHRAFFLNAERHGGVAMVTVSLRPYHKGLPLEAPRSPREADASKRRGGAAVMTEAAQLLPNFDSPLVNIGCDETFEIADKEEYLAFLLKVADAARRHGKRPMFWGDIVLKHPELVPRLPKDLIALDWGYEANHPFAREAATFARSGLDFYVCPGTSSWRSLAGRVENMRENLQAAEKTGREAGAKGYLLTAEPSPPGLLGGEREIVLNCLPLVGYYSFGVLFPWKGIGKK